MLSRLWHRIKTHEYELWVALALLISGCTGYIAGWVSRTAAVPKPPVRIIEPQEGSGLGAVGASQIITRVAQGRYVASKKGRRYHLPSCSGARTIKEENKIWFNTKEEAERAGYTAAANCEGL